MRFGIWLSLFFSFCFSIISINGCYFTPKKKVVTPIFPNPALVLSIARNNGMPTIQQGSRLLVLIPTDTFFEPLQTNLKFGKINAIIRMAQCVYQYSTFYPLSTVYVRGYTDKFFPPYTRQSLSQKYADTISAYLWNAGISNNRIISEGYGSNYPIASYQTVSGRGHNRRVEIQIN